MRNRLLALPLAAALILGPVAIAAPVHAATGAPTTVSTVTAGKAKKKATKATKVKKTTVKKAVKKAVEKVVRFEAVGRVDSVDPATGAVKVAVKGGAKDMRGKVVSIKLDPHAKIKLNGKSATLASLKPGARIAVSGKRTDGGPVAHKVIAKV